MAANGPELGLGSVGAEDEHRVDPERQQRDFALVQRVKQGYTPFIDEKGKRGPAVAGNLTDDAAEALGQLGEFYVPEMYREAYDRAKLTDNLTAIDVQDLANEAYFAVYDAALTWRLGGSSFLTHAKRFMPNHLNQYLDDHRTNVRLRRGRRKRIRNIGRRYWEMYGINEHPPLDTEIAEELEISETVMRRTRFSEALTERMDSLERAHFEERGKTFTGNSQAPTRWLPIDATLDPPPSIESALVAQDRIDLVEQIVYGDFPGLSDRDREILYFRYVDKDGPFTLEEVGEAFGLTKQRIQQLEKRALKGLRRALRDRRFTDYIDD